MKVSPCTHSFALFALSFVTIQSAFALSVDSKAVVNLQPRLDGEAVNPDASSSASPIRRRKKCSFTPSVSGVALSTGSPPLVLTGSPVTTSSAGNPAANATSTLANKLSYARSYKTKCSKKTGTVNLPLSSGGPDSGLSADSGSTGSGSGNTGSPDSGTPSVAGNDASESNPAATGNGISESTGSGEVAASASVCGPQQTVTVTSQSTVTVTHIAQAAASSRLNIATPNTLANNPTSAEASGGTSNTSSGSSGNPAQGISPDVASGSSAPIENAASASTSNNAVCTKCIEESTPSTTVAGGKAAEAVSGSGTIPSGSGLSGSGTTSSVSQSSASGSSLVGLSGSGASSVDGPYGNTTVSGATSPYGSSTPVVPVAVSNSTNATSNVKTNGQFWAGATIGTVMRMEAIPERVFYDYDGKTVKDPIKTLGDAGVNALRIESFRGQCLGPTKFVNNGSTLGDELTFSLDWGCIDTAVQTAQRGVAQGMRVVLTINQGFDIPEGMESYSYEQMVNEVQKEVKRQLQPFLDKKIVPDVILFENEGSDGFLFNDTSTGHTRGSDDGKAPKDQIEQEKCGKIPTGNMNSFPQYTGYLKAEVSACNEAITAAGFPTASVRYGLHSHGQYVQWKEGTFHGPNPASQTELKDTSGNICSNSVIPAKLLSANASEMITIMGFSAYPTPMTPTDINSQPSQHETFNRTLETLTQMMSYAEAYGKYESGPFTGEYKLQALGVEYATSYTYEEVPQEQQETEMMWSLVKQFPNVLGMMWYEPWYCHGDWEGGLAALCHKIDSKEISGQAPTDMLKTWGAAALSPWKK